MDFFECKVVYDKTMDNGQVKKTSESYLFEGANHGDAENRCTKELSPLMSGEWMVDKVQRKRFAEILDGEEDINFNVRLSFITLDEKSGAEKRQTIPMLVNASSFRDCLNKVEEHMKGSISDYIVNSISESAILDVYRLSGEQVPDEE